MKREKIEKMILEIFGTADYDLMKSYDPETAEEPEYCESKMKRLVKIVEKYLK